MYKRKLQDVVFDKKKMRTGLVNLKKTLSDEWAAFEVAVNNPNQDEDQLITLIPNLEDTIQTSIQALNIAKESLILQKREIEKKVAVIYAYDNDAVFDYRSINKAIHTLEEEILELKSKIKHIKNSAISHKQTQTAKKDLTKAIKLAQAQLDEFQPPAETDSKDAFALKSAAIVRLENKIKDATLAKEKAIEQLRQEIDSFVRKSRPILRSYLSTENYEKLKNIIANRQQMNFFEFISEIKQKIENNELTLANMQHLTNEMNNELIDLEVLALPKKHAQLRTRIADILNARSAPEQQDVNKRQIQYAFSIYKGRLKEARRQVLDAPDFALSIKEKKQYSDLFLAINNKPHESFKEPIAILDVEEGTEDESFVLVLNALNTKLSAPVGNSLFPGPMETAVQEMQHNEAPHQLNERGIEELENVIESCSLTVGVGVREEVVGVSLNIEETAEIEHNIATLTTSYDAQKLVFTQKRAVLYDDCKNDLNDAIVEINNRSREANAKIEHNKHTALAHIQQGIFYTAVAIAATSPVCVGIFEGLVAGFIIGVSTGVVGLPFWLIAGALVGCAIGICVSSSTFFAANKAKQAAQKIVTEAKKEGELKLATILDNSEFNLMKEINQN
ncbi:MAG: hypothetical protein K2Q14_06365, partial [Gammaproteobacteria bacterium]|nr:hypothetical protein [Gammaproteobacteria bacterium]